MRQASLDASDTSSEISTSRRRNKAITAQFVQKSARNKTTVSRVVAAAARCISKQLDEQLTAMLPETRERKLLQAKPRNRLRRVKAVTSEKYAKQ